MCSWSRRRFFCKQHHQQALRIYYICLLSPSFLLLYFATLSLHVRRTSHGRREIIYSWCGRRRLFCFFKQYNSRPFVPDVVSIVGGSTTAVVPACDKAERTEIHASPPHARKTNADLPPVFASRRHSRTEGGECTALWRSAVYIYRRRSDRYLAVCAG